MSPRVNVYACVSVLLCVCAQVCARGCMNNEIAAFSGFSLSHYVHMTYILAHSLSFSSCGTIFLFLYAHLTWRRVECLIARFNHNC